MKSTVNIKNKFDEMGGIFPSIYIMLLFLVILGVAVVQFYRSKTSTLTAWKGAGFGMYTAPNYDYRSVWLEIRSKTRSQSVRLYPLDERWREITQEQQDEFGITGSIYRMARNYRTFPSASSAEKLIENLIVDNNLLELNQLYDTHDADSNLSDSPTSLTIVSAEAGFSITEKVVRVTPIYSFSKPIIQP